MKINQVINRLQELQKSVDKQTKEHDPSFLPDNIVKIQLYYDCDIIVTIEDKKLESEIK
jgi:hypothetical protein